MKLEIIDYIEDSDNGGATVTVDIDESAKELLIQRGFNSLLLDAIEKIERDGILSKLVQEAQENGEYDESKTD